MIGKKHTHGFIKCEIEKEIGYNLLSTTYKNAKEKLEVKCNSNHIFHVRYDAWKSQGHRCPYCSGNVRLTYDFVKSNIEKEGYKLLSTNYVNNNKKLDIQCPKGHKYKVDYNHWSNHKTRCMKCFMSCKRSNVEKEIGVFIKSIYNGKVLKNNRTLIRNPKTNYHLELDFLLPLLNKAIEVNGEYYHNSDYSKYKDNIKKVWCINNNINLLVLSVKDFYKNKDIIFKKINNFIIKSDIIGG